jgi:hypothetical protein
MGHTIIFDRHSGHLKDPIRDSFERSVERFGNTRWGGILHDYRKTPAVDSLLQRHAIAPRRLRPG